MSSSVSIAISSTSLLRNIPELVAWGVGIVMAVIMVRRGGGRTEKLLLAGFILMFVAALAGPFMSYHNIAGFRGWVNWLSIPMIILGLAGFVCLVWAFWVRFWRRRVPA